MTLLRIYLIWNKDRCLLKRYGQNTLKTKFSFEVKVILKWKNETMFIVILEWENETMFILSLKRVIHSN